MTPATAVRQSSPDAFAYAVARALYRANPDKASEIADKIVGQVQALKRGQDDE